MMDGIFRPNPKTKRVNIENIEMKIYLAVSKLHNTFFYICIYYYSYVHTLLLYIYICVCIY
jgi:hypothetical protein